MHQHKEIRVKAGGISLPAQVRMRG